MRRVFGMLAVFDSPEAVRTAAADLRQRAKRNRVRADLSAERLAAHMSKTGVHEELLQQRWRDLEGKKVLSIIAGQSGYPQTFGAAPGK